MSTIGSDNEVDNYDDDEISDASFREQYDCDSRGMPAIGGGDHSESRGSLAFSQSTAQPSEHSTVHPWPAPGPAIAAGSPRITPRTAKNRRGSPVGPSAADQDGSNGTHRGGPVGPAAAQKPGLPKPPATPGAERYTIAGQMGTPEGSGGESERSAGSEKRAYDDRMAHSAAAEALNSARKKAKSPKPTSAPQPSGYVTPSAATRPVPTGTPDSWDQVRARSPSGSSFASPSATSPGRRRRSGPTSSVGSDDGSRLGQTKAPKHDYEFDMTTSSWRRKDAPGSVGAAVASADQPMPPMPPTGTFERDALPSGRPPSGTFSVAPSLGSFVDMNAAFSQTGEIASQAMAGAHRAVNTVAAGAAAAAPAATVLTALCAPAIACDAISPV